MCFRKINFFSSKDQVSKFIVPVVPEYANLYVCVPGDAELFFGSSEKVSALATQFHYEHIPAEQAHLDEIVAFNAAKKLYPNNNFFILILRVPDRCRAVEDKLWATLNKHLIKVRSFNTKDKFIAVSDCQANDPYNFPFKIENIKLPSTKEMLPIMTERRKAKEREAKEKALLYLLRKEELKLYRQKVIRDSRDATPELKMDDLILENINTLNRPDSFSL